MSQKKAYLSRKPLIIKDESALASVNVYGLRSRNRSRRPLDIKEFFKKIFKISRFNQIIIGYWNKAILKSPTIP